MGNQTGIGVTVTVQDRFDQLVGLLKFLVTHQGSDLHVSSGALAMVRIRGALHRVDTERFTDDGVKALIFPVMTDTQLTRLERERSVEFSFHQKGLGIFRTSVFLQRKGLAFVIRALTEEPMTLDELGVPEEMKLACLEPHGLVLVTGLARSGKTTTLAALVDFINSHRKCHVVTLEDPIEYLHESKKSMINQRARGEHFISYEKAIQDSLFEDPDVIVLTELETPGVALQALKASEKGHLVIAIIAAEDGVESVIKLAQMFPNEKQNEIRFLLAKQLKAVLSQNLVLSGDKSQMLGQFAFLRITEKIKKMVINGRFQDVRQYTELANPVGMSTLRQKEGSGKKDTLDLNLSPKDVDTAPSPPKVEVESGSVKIEKVRSEPQVRDKERVVDKKKRIGRDKQPKAQETRTTAVSEIFGTSKADISDGSEEATRIFKKNKNSEDMDEYGETRIFRTGDSIFGGTLNSLPPIPEEDEKTKDDSGPPSISGVDLDTYAGEDSDLGETTKKKKKSS